MKRLYKITMSDHDEIYVVALNSHAAMEAAEKRWRDMDFKSSGGTAVSCVVMAEDTNYPARSLKWLLDATS